MRDKALFTYVKFWSYLKPFSFYVVYVSKYAVPPRGRRPYTGAHIKIPLDLF